MKKTLTMAVATLIVGAVTASAAITLGPVTDTSSQIATTGTWDLTPTGPTQFGGTYWTAWVDGQVVALTGGLQLYVLKVEGVHAPNAAPPPAPTASLAVGLVNVPTASGQALAEVPHNPPGLDKWSLVAWTSAGGIDFGVTGTHPVPEPGSFALIAGLGLVGFAAYRRTRA